MKFLIITLILLLSFSQNNRLVFLYTHFRHGARAPMAIDENFTDLVKEKWNNPGELTGVGQRMHYLLGLRNRIKYIKNETFLSEKFDPHEILIFSSNLNRTIVSVSSQLQGFFPQSSEKGEVLTENQENVAYPGVDVNCDEINNEIKNLNGAALPNKMTLAPVRMVNDNDKKMNVYDLTECTEERDQIKKENRETIPYVVNFTREYNEKYGETINKFLGTNNKNFTMLDIDEFCDAFLSSYTDQRDLTEFKKTGLDLKEMNDYCYEYFRVTYLYQFHGDKDKILAHVDSSKLMTELMYYMKRRLDADITEEDEDSNIKDYSRPKMFMLSGHDSSISADEILLIRALNLNESELFIFPKFASQLAIEVKTKNDEKKSSYSDYYVVGYIDDKEIFKEDADIFINKIEKEIWTEKQVNDFCGFDETQEIVKNSNDLNNSTNSNSDGSYYFYNSAKKTKNDNAKTTYKVLMIIFMCLSAILLALSIFLAYKLSQDNNDNSSINKNINPYNSTNSVKVMK